MWSSGQRRRERRASGAHRRVWMRVLFQADAKPLKRAATSLCCIAPSAARFVGVILSLFPRKFALVRCCPPRDEGGCALPVAIIPFSAPASWRRSSSRATSQGRPRPYSPCGVTPHRPGLRWPARSPAAAPPAPAEQPPFWALLYASLVRAPADNQRRSVACASKAARAQDAAGRTAQVSSCARGGGAQRASVLTSLRPALTAR